MKKEFLSKKSFIYCFVVFFVLVNSAFFVYAATKYDIVLKNGTIIDGSGNPAFQGDIAIIGQKIERIGRVEYSKDTRVLDIKGYIVTPGFIDVHTHCDRSIEKIPTVDNYILQGVTTVIGGNCGGHPYPVKKLFQNLEKQGISINFGVLVGHNTIRRIVMGHKMEKPDVGEIEKMQSLIKQEMKAGALGFSTGLSYLPGIYSETTELIQLASCVADYGGIYASHIRDQGKNISDAINEAIEIGEKNGIPVQISHIKLADDSVWGKTELITGPVEKARKRGIKVFLDQYPYTATSSGFTSSFPAWAFEGGKSKFLERLEDEKIYEKIKDFVIQRRLTSVKGIDKLETIYIASYPHNPNFQGKNLREILLSKKQSPTVINGADLIIEIERNGGASGVFFQMDDQDVEELMKLPYNMHASDGSIQTRGDGVPHPRSYGTFPRVYAHYVRNNKVIALEEAVRKMTSLPAEVFHLRKRGLLAEGYFADITVFDLSKFKDTATYTDPHKYPEGLIYVLVNGRVVVENHKHNGTRPGKILKNPVVASGE